MLPRFFRIAIVIFSLVSLVSLTAVIPVCGASAEKPEAVAAQKTEAAKEAQAGEARHDVQEELGKKLPYLSVVPFIAILLCIALIPLFMGHWWEPNFNKGIISFACSLPVFIYLLILGPLGQEALIDVLRDYYAFIVLLVALFTISGGIYLEGNLKATPMVNTLIPRPGGASGELYRNHRRRHAPDPPAAQNQPGEKIQESTSSSSSSLWLQYRGFPLTGGRSASLPGLPLRRPFFWTLRLWPIWLPKSPCS